MTIAYFDGCAFLELEIQEEGRVLSATLWDGCAAAVSCRLTYPQVRAVRAGAGRAHRLDPAEHRRAEVMWEDFWAATRPVEPTEASAAHAGHLASRHPPQGADTA
jgi:hypothetical protein